MSDFKTTNDYNKKTINHNQNLQLNDAYYIVQGYPQKLNKSNEDGLSSSPETLETDSLLQFDLKFDSLKTFLHSVTTVINQHANLLNSMQTDLKNKIYLQQVSDSFDRISQSVVFHDQDLTKVIHNQQERVKLENNGRILDDTTNKLSNNLSNYGQAITHIFLKNRDNENKIFKTDTELSKKVPKEEFKSKVKKTKQKLGKKIEDLQKLFESKLSDVEKKFMGKIEGFEAKVLDVEKATLWKIKDCEELLRIRVNEEYVADALKGLEEKIYAYLKKLNEGSTDHTDEISKSLLLKMKTFEDNVTDKLNSQKKYFKDLENDLTKRLTIEKFEEFKRNIGTKSDECLNKIKEIIKKYDPAIDQLITDQKHVNEKTNEFEKIITKIIAQLESGNINVGNISNINGHLLETDVLKVSEAEKQIFKLKEEMEKICQMIKHLQDEISKKPDLSSINLELMKKIDKAEAMNLINQLGNDDDKMRKLYKDIEDLYRRVDICQDLCDKKIRQFRKELDTATLLKQIKAKADEEDVKKGFFNVDAKVSALSELINSIKKDYESFNATIRAFKLQMMKASDNALVTTKQVNPFACLSCGRGDSNFVPPMHSVKGNDGKVYRVDNRLSSSFQENPEEYDVGIEIFNEPKHLAHIHKEDIKSSSIATETFYYKNKSALKERPIASGKNVTPEKSFGITGSNAYNQNITPPIRRFFRPSSAKK